MFFLLYFFSFASCFIFFACSPAYAAELGAGTQGGVSIADTSSTGFNGSVGTITIFDLYQKLGSRVELGLRTSGQGGGDALRFYRLSSGPLLTISLPERWLLQIHGASFRELAEDDGNESYRSQGSLIMLGWQRRLPVFPRVEFSYGSLVQWHRGKVTREKSRIDSSSTSGPLNQGMSKALHAGFRVWL